MRPDIDIKYYYGKFIEDANKAYDINKEDYNNLISLRKRLYRLVANKKAIINEFFNLDINNTMKSMLLISMLVVLKLVLLSLLLLMFINVLLILIS